MTSFLHIISFLDYILFFPFLNIHLSVSPHSTILGHFQEVKNMDPLPALNQQMNMQEKKIALKCTLSQREKIIYR